MTDLSHPQFAEPYWLWLAVLAPLTFGALAVYAARKRSIDLDRLVSADARDALIASHSPIRRGIKIALLLAAAAGFGFALARPQWGRQQTTARELGEDMVFVIDCSKSMLAADVSPNRLERAKLAVMDFVQRHGRGRVGLVSFAGQAFLQCPLTLDYDAFEETLRALDDRTISVPGTDLGRALDESFRAMEQEHRRKIMVLLTDGEDLEDSGLETARRLAREGVVVFTVGIGTPSGTEIRVLNDLGQPELVRDREGVPVRSRLDEEVLREIARVTRGRYYSLGSAGEGLAGIRLDVDSSEAGGARVREFGVDRYHVMVAALLVLLVVESLCGTRRWREGRGREPEVPAAGPAELATARREN